MAIRIAHVVTDLSQINFGIWNAALYGSSFLDENYGIKSCAIVCEPSNANSVTISIPIIWAGTRPHIEKVVTHLTSSGFNPSETIIVTHGCWLMPTRLGYQLKKKGYKWIYTPHGMLEPWSLAHHRWKKMIYFHLVEKRYFRNADAVRAVSKTEQTNLEKLIRRKVYAVENGVVMPEMPVKASGKLQFLFMARLHHKKGILPLITAWNNVMRQANAQLIIAGPDEGELNKIKPYLSGNVKYVGPVYGEDKKELLRQSHYYLLPSYSEGFPTSVVEAMSYGAIPMISSGCNFPEVFVRKLGFCIEPDEENIALQLSALRDKPFDQELSHRNHEFINGDYSEDAIGKKLYEMYSFKELK